MNESVHTSGCKHLLKVIRLDDAEELPGRPRTRDQGRGAFVIVVKCWLCLFHFFRRFRRLDSGNGNQNNLIFFKIRKYVILYTYLIPKFIYVLFTILLVYDGLVNVLIYNIYFLWQLPYTCAHVMIISE